MESVWCRGVQASYRFDLLMSRAGVNAAIGVDVGTKNSRSSPLYTTVPHRFLPKIYIINLNFLIKISKTHNAFWKFSITYKDLHSSV